MHGRRGLDWRDLQYFLAVSRGGALSVAARELGVEHTTVARRIQSLEQTMDATLFERHPRGYRLTRQGEQLLAGVEAMEREAQEVAFSAGGGLSGTVRIDRRQVSTCRRCLADGSILRQCAAAAGSP